MFFLYQIKVGLCLIVFYLLWKLLLSRETFHLFNRMALLVVMALALVLPWIRFSLDVSSPVTEQMVMLEELIVTPSGVVQPQQAVQPWNVLNIATVVYFVVMAIVLAWLLHSQWNLRRLLKQGRTESLPKFIPGRKDGKAVAVWYALPISFKLQGDPEKLATE